MHFGLPRLRGLLSPLPLLLLLLTGPALLLGSTVPASAQERERPRPVSASPT